MNHVKIRVFTQKIIHLLFPERHSAKRRTFDFSRAPPSELARILPIARYPPKSNNDIIACLSYRNPVVRTLVWHVKTKKDRDAMACAGYVLAQKLREVLHKGGPGSATRPPILIPIPIHQKRRRERGYNQCELLAIEMKRHCDIEIRTNILYRNHRKGRVQKQAFKNRAERIAGMKNAFSANRAVLEKINGISTRQIFVLDDVLTTGSTMNEAIVTLRAAGCRNICGLALAH